MPMPTLIPIAFDAGPDLRLFEANNWPTDGPGAQRHRLTIRCYTRGDKTFWVVEQGDAFLCRIKGGPVVLAYDRVGMEKFDTPEQALALVEEYLTQPVNPYLWVRENAD